MSQCHWSEGDKKKRNWEEEEVCGQICSNKLILCHRQTQSHHVTKQNLKSCYYYYYYYYYYYFKPS